MKHKAIQGLTIDFLDARKPACLTAAASIISPADANHND